MSPKGKALQDAQTESSHTPLSLDSTPLQPKTVRPEPAFTLPAHSPTDAPTEETQPSQHAVRSDATKPSLPDDQISHPQTRTPMGQPDNSTHRQYTFLSQEPGVLETAAPRSRELSLQADSKSPLLTFQPPDTQTLPIIRQQLELLHSGQFVWQGESWQGQQIEWTIQHDEKRKTQQSGNAWETSLKLDLPALGPVSAKVRVSDGQVSIHLIASREYSVKMMEVGRKQLLEGIESAGLQLVSMEVKREPAP
jgi:hypothetical protein